VPSSVRASSPSGTPSPTWSKDDQAAINAVQTFLQVWSQVSQGLPDSDVNAIHSVAISPDVDAQNALWVQWIGNGVHLVGAPSFYPSLVTVGELDDQAQRYYVYGCYVMGDSHLSDAGGNPTGVKSADRRPVTYDVILIPDGHYFVFNEKEDSGTC